MKILSTLFIALCLFGVNSFSQVDFTASGNNVCAPANISFTNTSSIGVHYDWFMGDGTNYNDQLNVSHTYSVGGTYYVELNAYDALYNFIGNYGMYIDVTGPPTQINMPSAACPGDHISMNVWMPDMISWSWDMGDGTNYSGNSQVEHTYGSVGVYYPSVTIVSQCGTFTVDDTITVTTGLTDFNYYTDMWISPDTVCPNSDVYGSTYSGFSSYLWDYGDGNTGSNDYEYWSYSAVGNYTVTLTTYNGCGADTVITLPIVVSATTPVQNPSIDIPDTICPGEQFYASASAGDGVDFVWDMGDGSGTINDQGHQHDYASTGTYYVSVTITNACGNNVVLNDSIVVSPNAGVNDPYLGISQYFVCPGDDINFWSNYDYSFYIDYGDGTGSSTDGYHSYSAPGVYPITCTIQNACGNSVTLTDVVTVQNNLPINTSNIYASAWPSPACPGSPIEMYAEQGYQSYSWDFGDGTNGTGQQIDHIYNTVGSYNALVTIENGCGSQATVGVNVQIQDNLPVTNVYLDMLVDTTCLGNAVFMQTDNESGYSYLWDLGDGSTATTFGVSHSYAALGVYPISLTITNVCGNDTVLVDTIVVSNNYTPDPSSIQVFVTPTGCIGDELSFVLIPSGLGDIVWDFGDGTSTNVVESIFVQGVANVDVSSHSYSAPGTYWASYTITNACGNAVTDSVEMTIGVPGDNVNMNVELLIDESITSCQGTPVEFMTFGGGTYIWTFGDGSGQLVTYDAFTPVYHTYADAGSYSVSVQGINGCGNTDMSDEIIIIPPSKIEVSTNTIIEPNCGSINGLAVVSASGGIPPYNYSWTNGDTGVIADSLASGIYVVTVSDINDCSNEGIATVSDEEGVVILVDNIVDVDCYGENNGSISVSLLGGQPPYTILWSNGDQTEDIYGLQAGPYEIFVTDANGCFSVESIEVTQPDKSNVSIITQVATCGSTNGSAVATVNNGTGPYNFIWPNATGPSNSTGGLAPGIHTLLVIDGNTCLLQKDFSINESGSAIILKDSIFTGTCNGDLSDIYISTVGGQQPFTYAWSNGTSVQDLADVLPGEYTVQVEGNNGCSSYATFTVEESLPDETTICMVDVDTLTGTNLIVWSPVTGAGIDSYNIYKESSQSGLYYLIANQSADSISQYFDYLSDPSIRSWRYKVAAVDDCGNEAPLSDEHKTIHLTSNVGIGGEVNLIWDHYQGFSYPTYYVNRWHPTTGWEIIDSLASNLISYTDLTPTSDSNMVYMISIALPGTCTAQKASDYNSSRSNRQTINGPIDLDNDLGVDDEQVDFSIYPNPTNGMVQISYSRDLTAIRLYDMSGQLVFENINPNGMTHSIDMNSFERGVYTLQLTAADEIITGKVIRN